MGDENMLHFMCCPSSLVKSTVVTPIPTTPEPTTVFSEDFESSLNAEGVRILSSQPCGEHNEIRVKNGEVTSLGEFPWMALLAYDTKPKVTYKCGGSLVTSKHVLTAAHCVVNLDVDV